MPPKPLAGIRVLELARILAGPWAGQLLARRRGNREFPGRQPVRYGLGHASLARPNPHLATCSIIGFG